MAVVLRSLINNAPPAERGRLRTYMNCRCCSNHQKIRSNFSEEQLVADLTIVECSCICADEILRYVRMKTWATPVVEIGVNEFHLSLNGLTGNHNGVMRCEDIQMREPQYLGGKGNPEVGDLKLRLGEIPSNLQNSYGGHEPIETPRTRQRRLRSMLSTSSQRMARSFTRGIRGTRNAFNRSMKNLSNHGRGSMAAEPPFPEEIRV